MQSRMNNPAMVIPDAMKALRDLSSAVGKCGVPKSTLGLVELRASQINGCGVCVDMHARLMRQAGETDERLFAVAAWRDAPYFSDAERAALALTEPSPGSAIGRTRCPTRFGTRPPDTTMSWRLPP